MTDPNSLRFRHGVSSLISRTGKRPGVTLAELVVSMTIASLVMAGLASAMLIAVRAIDTGDSPAVQVADAKSAVDEMSADLSHAIAIEEQTEKSVVVVVPDRDMDGLAETIRYEWSGIAGDPLLREYNEGDATVAAGQVHGLTLSYRPRPISATPLETSNAFKLASLDEFMGGSLKDYGIDYNHWCAQYFKPTLPVNAVLWGVANVSVSLKKDRLDRTLAVALHTADVRLKPTSQVLSEVTLQTDMLPVNYAWRSFSFAVTGLDPATGICLVVRQLANDTGAKLQYLENGFNMPQNAHWMTTSDAGVLWSTAVNHRDMLFYVNGTVTTRGPARW